MFFVFFHWQSFLKRTVGLPHVPSPAHNKVIASQGGRLMYLTANIFLSKKIPLFSIIVSVASIKAPLTHFCNMGSIHYMYLNLNLLNVPAWTENINKRLNSCTVISCQIPRNYTFLLLEYLVN